jgi:hypothetical protein
LRGAIARQKTQGYQSEVVLAETMQIAPLALPDYILEIREILPLVAD